MGAWTGRSVLVTGAGGFIGSHLAERLVTEGANVRAFVHYNALASSGWIDESPLKKEMEIISADIADADCVEDAVSGCDTVFHLAALIGIPYSYHAPRSYIRTNTEGTLNVLQAARDADVGRIVLTSTSEVYGTAREVPIREMHALQAQSPYAASKIAADKLGEAFHLSFGLPVTTVRPFNTFGPRQSMRAVIPTIIGQCLAGLAVRLGSLHPTRDLNYVSNTVDGFLCAAGSEKAVGKVMNFGSGREISIGDLAHLIGKLTGRPIAITTESERIRPTNSEVERLVADNSLARQELGWEPRVGLEDGLRDTIDWIGRHLDRYHSHGYQI
jgi:NAD dependent epimerase/dehydratase